MGRPRLDDESRDVLLLLARFRAASAAQLQGLLPGQGSRRTIQRFIAHLKGLGFIRGIDLSRRRTVYRLTGAAVRSLDELEQRVALRSPDALTPDGAIAGWQRAALWVALRAEGYHVGCDYEAFRAVVDAYRERLRSVAAAPLRTTFANALQAMLGNLPSRYPWRCRRCGIVTAERLERHTHPKTDEPCAGRLYLTDYLVYDVAYRQDELVFVVADNPYRSVRAQLEVLPVQVAVRPPADSGEAVAYLAPRFSVVFVPTCDGSVWSPGEQTWMTRGPRLRRWHGYLQGRSRGTFPYHRVLMGRDPPSAAVFSTVAQRGSYAHGLVWERENDAI